MQQDTSRGKTAGQTVKQVAVDKELHEVVLHVVRACVVVHGRLLTVWAPRNSILQGQQVLFSLQRQDDEKR